MQSDSDRLIHDEEYWPPPTHPLRLLTAIGILAVAVVVCLTWFAGTAGLAGGSSIVQDEAVVIPRVGGLDEAAATARLTEAGFEVEVLHERNVNVAVGTVFGQEPRGGLLGSPGETIVVRVSAGDGFVLVPQIEGSLLADLPTQLGQYGLQIGAVTQEHNVFITAGQVLVQIPAPGAEVPVGTPVDVIVSQGPPPLPMPDVVGMTESDATEALTAAGFQVTSHRIYSSTVRFGHVIATNPAPGTEVPFGSAVALQLSRGAAPPPTTTTTRPPTTTPPETTPPETTPPPTTPPPTTPPPTTPPPTTPPATTPPGNSGGGGTTGDEG